MADTMEGVVTEGEQPKTENVEQKAIAGKDLPTRHTTRWLPYHLDSAVECQSSSLTLRCAGAKVADMTLEMFQLVC